MTKTMAMRNTARGKDEINPLVLAGCIGAVLVAVRHRGWYVWSTMNAGQYGPASAYSARSNAGAWLPHLVSNRPRRL